MSLRCTCGAVLRVEDETVGQTVTCPQCGALLLVPSPTGAGGTPLDSAAQLRTEDLDRTGGEVPSELIDFQSAMSELQVSEEELSNLVACGDLRVIRSAGKPMFDTSNINNLRKNRETEQTMVIPSGGAAPSDSAAQFRTEDLDRTGGDDDRTSETIIIDDRTELALPLPSGPQGDFSETPIENLDAGRSGLAIRELTADETSATGPSGAAFTDSDASVPDHYEHDRLPAKRLTSISLIVVAALILLGAAAMLMRFVGERNKRELLQLEAERLHKETERSRQEAEELRKMAERSHRETERWRKAVDQARNEEALHRAEMERHRREAEEARKTADLERKQQIAAHQEAAKLRHEIEALRKEAVPRARAREEAPEKPRAAKPPTRSTPRTWIDLFSPETVGRYTSPLLPWRCYQPVGGSKTTVVDAMAKTELLRRRTSKVATERRSEAFVIEGRYGTISRTLFGWTQYEFSCEAMWNEGEGRPKVGVTGEDKSQALSGCVLTVTRTGKLRLSRRGGNVGLALKAPPVLSASDWHVFRARRQDQHLMVWVNGVLVYESNEVRFRSDTVLLGVEGGRVLFRNIRARNLGSTDRAPRTR